MVSEEDVLSAVDRWQAEHTSWAPYRAILAGMKVPEEDFETVVTRLLYDTTELFEPELGWLTTWPCCLRCGKRGPFTAGSDLVYCEWCDAAPIERMLISDPLSKVEVAREVPKGEYQFEYGPIDASAFPPCMQHILAQLHAGENPPHTARFAVTAFLHGVGLPPAGIMNLFATTPNFDEKRTRYQVEHIAGEKTGRPYTAPACATMKKQGICHGEDERCRRTAPEGRRYVQHPLAYYRWATKS